MLCAYSSCEKNNPVSNKTVLSIAIKNHKNIDSIVVYDKSNSWHIASCIRFTESSKSKDTLLNIEQKIYQLYVFSEDKQLSFGEVLLSPNSKITLEIDENTPNASATYSGDHNNINTYLAFKANAEKQLSNTIMPGIETTALDELIHKTNTEITNTGLKLQTPDSIANKGIQQFEDFSAILRMKNTKYRYKNNLISKNGNSFYVKTSAQDSIHLSTFKGKYLYIDVWATWCKPCKVEYPLLKTLEQQLYSKNTVDIISISMDREFDKWTNYLDKNSMEGHHFHTTHDSEFVKFYDIGALPRFILLNPEGTIISADAIRPSNSEILNYLSSL